MATRGPSRPVSFRLPRSQYDELKARAEKYRMSVGEYMRKLALDDLTRDVETLRLCDELRELRRRLGALEEEVKH